MNALSLCLGSRSTPRTIGSLRDDACSVRQAPADTSGTDPSRIGLNRRNLPVIVSSFSAALAQSAHTSGPRLIGTASSSAEVH